MRTIRKRKLLGGTILVGLMSASLVACGGGDKKDAATSKGDVSVQLGSVAKGEVDIEGVLAYLPEGFVATYDTSDYSDSSGLTTLTNVRFSSEEDTDVGLQIGKLVIAGFDKTFVDARVAGTNFDDSAIVIDHLEASDLSVFGVEKFYGPLFDAYLSSVNELTEELIDTPIPDVESSLNAIDFSIGRILVDDFELLPVLLPQDEDGENGDEGFRFLQSFVGYSMSMGAKKLSMRGYTMGFDMTQDGMDAVMKMDMPLIEMEGWRGGDYKRSYAENITFDMSVPNEEQDEDFPLESIDVSGTIGSYLIEDVRLNEGLEWLVRGEWPPVTETDLISFGRFTTNDMNFSIFGAPFYSIESSTTDMSEWHWLVPTKIESTTENLIYDIGSLFETIVSLIPEGEGGEQAEEFARFKTAMDALEAYDLSAPSMDFSFNWDWNPDTGEGALKYFSGLDGYGTMTFDISGAVANFQRWVDEEAKGPQPGDQFTELMEETTFLYGMRLEMEDRGGNDRLYDATLALANALKDDVPELATLAVYDKSTLKLLVANSIIGGAGFIKEEVPVAFDYANLLAAYLSEGGKFTIALEPDTPMDAAAFAELEGLEDPEQIEPLLEKFGFSVTHTPN